MLGEKDDLLTESPTYRDGQINKAGYTATSCGWVGRGGNARFPTFRLETYFRLTEMSLLDFTSGTSSALQLHVLEEEERG